MRVAAARAEQDRWRVEWLMEHEHIAGAADAPDLWIGAGNAPERVGKSSHQRVANVQGRAGQPDDGKGDVRLDRKELGA
jgi:hypothetical protein